jgi:hypothetical protein
MSDMQTRQQLLAVTERDEAELEHALVDLKRAVHRPFAIGSEVGEHIGAHLAPWLVAGVLIGLWLGSRTK